MQPDEMFDDRLRIRGVHRERFARPVDAGTHATDLAADRAGRKFFPFPDFFDELLAAEVATCRLAGQLETALDDHLRGDSGVIGARLPYRARQGVEGGKGV